MLLRRICDHVRSQNWFAIVVDLVIVVLGVFIALQASNWNQARIADETARVYRQRIIEDLRSNEHDMRDREAYYRQAHRSGAATLAALRRPPEELGEQFLVDAYQASQLAPRTVNRTTYDEILSVGAVNTIGDVALRRRLASYYLNVETAEAIFRTTTPYRDRVRRYMPNAVQQRIRTNCPETLRIDRDGTIIQRLTTRCTLGLEPSELAEAVRAVHGAPELELDLTRHLSDLDTKFILFDAMESTAALFRGELESRETHDSRSG